MLKDKLRSHILENFLFTDDQSELNNNDSFMANEIIDSTGILEIIEFLEDECQIKIEDDDMIPENLDSVDRILEFVRVKQSA